MIRFGKTADRHEIMDIWEESFGDAQEEIAEFFHCLAEEVRVLVWEEEGRLSGQLCLLPVKLWSYGKAAKAEYIYAVATRKEARGRGICTGLLDAAAGLLKQEGSCAVLVPADGALAGFYERRGFSHCFREELWEIKASGEKEQDSIGKECQRNRGQKPVPKPMTASAYIKCRREAFAETAGIEPSGAMLEYALSSFSREGGVCAELQYGEKTCGVLFRVESGTKAVPEEKALLIQEITLQDREEAMGAAQMLLHHFGFRRAVLRRSYHTCGLYLPPWLEENGCFNLVLD